MDMPMRTLPDPVRTERMKSAELRENFLVTGNYSFVWAMGGEKQGFDDMDPVAMDQLQ